MNKIGTILLIATLCSQISATAKTSEAKTGISVDVDFQLKDAKKSVLIKHKSILHKENNGWTPLAPAQNGVALLGRIQKPENGVLTIQYMVVDTSTTPVVVHQMGVVTRLGQPAKIDSVLKNSEGISISSVLQETTYREETPAAATRSSGKPD